MLIRGEYSPRPTPIKGHKNISARPGIIGLITCRNISGHVLMGRPAARLETGDSRLRHSGGGETIIY